MTLLLTLVNSHGAWQTSDTRLFNLTVGKRMADPSTKQFAFTTHDGGGTIAYTGIGVLNSGEHVSDVIFKLLRGVGSDVENTLAAVQAFATDRIAPVAFKHGIGHTFVACGFKANVPWLASISNDAASLYHDRILRVGNPKSSGIRDHFAGAFVDIGRGAAIAAGMHESVSDADYEILQRIMRRRPARPDDYLRILAEITRRASKTTPQYISEESHGVRVNRAGRVLPPSSFTWGKPAEQRAMPKGLLWGLDPSSSAQKLLEGVESAAGDKARIELAFRAAIRTFMEISIGQRVIHRTAGKRGTITSSFADPTGDLNLVSVRWDGDSSVDSVNRADIAILPPGPDAK